MRARRRRRLITVFGVALLVATGSAAWASAHQHRHSTPTDTAESEEVRAAPYAATGSCGVRRWSVKTGTDADVAKIDLRSTQPTTVAALTALAPPASLPADHRVRPVETTVYRLTATLMKYRLEPDSDYHLLLADAAGNKMIAAVPDPVCVGASSPLLTAIKNAREQFDAKFVATEDFKTANIVVTLTGIGFFDSRHGQDGVARNGIELHAVTDVQFASAGHNKVAVVNPGSQTGSVGGVVNLQIQARDSAAGQTLAYAARGLPDGVSINATSGLISGTPTAEGTSTVTVTVADTDGSFGSMSFSLAIGGKGGCAGQRLGNPGFETGAPAPWTASDGVISSSGTEPAHSGSWEARFDGYGSPHTDVLSQVVKIPAGCHARLSFWLHVDSAETTTSGVPDRLSVSIGSATQVTYSNLDSAAGYLRRSFDVSGYAGRSVTVRFVGTENGSRKTSFVVDDTALTLS